MVTTLVLGCSSGTHGVVSDLADGRGSLRVVDDDESRVESLRNEKVAAEQGEYWTSAVVDALEHTPDLVFVGGRDSDRNHAAARAARDAFPDALLIAYVGLDATADQRSAMNATADRVVEPGAAVVDAVAEEVSSGDAERLTGLRETLESIDGTLGVFMHDNPDPDAIAAGVTLCHVADHFGVEAEACYFGDISHQENRAFVNLLDFDLRNVRKGDDFEYDAYALVDHSAPGVNDQLPEDTPIEVIIDHHPPKTEVNATYVDLREDVGAASTIMVDYLQGYAMDVPEAVATGLLYGVRVDTKDFSREITTEDFEAGAWLVARADTDVLERVESPSISADTLDTIARAIQRRTLEGSILASCVGAISDRDALAQAADRLLAMEGVTVTIVYGFMDGTVYISTRARGSDIDLGETLRQAFSDVGSAGGHHDMAGAQLTLGLFDQLEGPDEETLANLVENVVNQRFFGAVYGDSTAEE